MKVLVISNNETINQLFKNYLITKGYDTITTTSLKDGINLVHNQKFDCIVLEPSGQKLKYNKMLSFELEKLDPHRNKIIILTAVDYDELEIKKWFDHGLYAFLKKPSRTDIILEKINENQRNSRKIQKNTIEDIIEIFESLQPKNKTSIEHHNKSKRISFKISKQHDQATVKSIENQQHGVIVYLDALGTKGIWKQNDPNIVLKRWNSLIKDVQQHVKGMYEKKKIKSSFNAFSDTVIMTFTGTNDEVLLENLGSMLVTLVVVGLSLGIYFRGCITVGDFFHEKQMIIGPAVDEAAQYYMLPEWIGISASPSTHRILQDIEKEKNDWLYKWFFKYDIPLKNSVERRGWAIRWPYVSNDFIELVLDTYKFAKQYNTIEKILDEQLKNTSELEAIFKWRNTIEFFNEVKIKNNKI